MTGYIEDRLAKSHRFEMDTGSIGNRRRSEGAGQLRPGWLKIKETVDSGRLAENLAREMNLDLDSILNRPGGNPAHTGTQLTPKERADIHEKLQKIGRRLLTGMTAEPSPSFSSAKTTGRIINLYG